MPVPNQKFREAVFQLLYSQDMGPAESEDHITLVMKELSISKKSAFEAQETVVKVLQKCEEIDTLIAKHSEQYAFDRIHSVERNILRLGIFELLFDESIPDKVAISEAMRLAKKFSSGDARGFVNAVMDRIYKEAHDPMERE